MGATCSPEQPPPTPPLQGAQLSPSLISKDAVEEAQALSHSEDVDIDDGNEDDDDNLMMLPLDDGEDDDSDEERVEVLIEALRSGMPSNGQVSDAWDIISAKPSLAKYAQPSCALCKNKPVYIGQYIAMDARIGNWVHAHCLLKSVTDAERLSIRSPFEVAGLLTAPGAHLQGNGQDSDRELPRLLPMSLEEDETTNDDNDGGSDSADEASPLDPEDGHGNEARALVLSAATDKERQPHGEPQWTEEQQEAATYLPSPGAFVTVQAFAGTGKTTTARAIIRERLAANRSLRILYVVFGKAAEEEMSKKEEKLVKDGLLSIKTCHSLAWARVIRNGTRAIDIDAPKVDDLVKRFALRAYACQGPAQQEGNRKERRVRATARRLAGFIRSTLTNFLHSADRGDDERFSFLQCIRLMQRTSICSSKSLFEYCCIPCDHPHCLMMLRHQEHYPASL